MNNTSLYFSAGTPLDDEETKVDATAAEVKDRLSSPRRKGARTESPQKAKSPKKESKQAGSSPAKSKTSSPRKRILSQSDESVEIGLRNDVRSVSKSPKNSSVRRKLDKTNGGYESSEEAVDDDRLQVNIIPPVTSPTGSPAKATIQPPSPVKARKALHQEEDEDADVVHASDDSQDNNRGTPDIFTNGAEEQPEECSQYVFTQPSVAMTQSNGRQQRDEEYYSLSDDEEELSEQRVRQLKHQLR